MALLAKPALWFIRGYQRFISPLFPARCKYYPTCSAYAYTSLSRHGLCKGTLLSGWRLIRCNPFSNGGVDYPPEKGKWGSGPYHQMSDAELQAHWEAIAQQEESAGGQETNRQSLGNTPAKKHNTGGHVPGNHALNRRN